MSPSHPSTNADLPSTFCDTTMYIYVAEIFPTEIRPIGMGFSLFGQFACQSALSPSLSKTAPSLTDKLSHAYPPPNRADGLQQCGLEILPRDHSLVRGVHPR